MREKAVLAEAEVAPVREIAVFADAAGGFAGAQVAPVGLKPLENGGTPNS